MPGSRIYIGAFGTGRMVSGAGQTELDSAGLGLCPGLNPFIYYDGCGGLAYLASGRVFGGRPSAGSISASATSKWSLVVVFLRIAESRTGLYRYCFALGCDSGHHDFILVKADHGRDADTALFWLGWLCFSTQFCHLALKPKLIISLKNPDFSDHSGPFLSYKGLDRRVYNYILFCR